MMYIRCLKLLIIWVFCTQFTVNTTIFKSNGEFAKSYVRRVRSLLDQGNSNLCGKPVFGQGTIINGADVTRGSFPWLAVLVTINGKFICGGSLITRTKVVSAAHCILQKNEKIPLLPRNLKILLGVHDLNDVYEAGRVVAIVKFIHIHPDWNPNAPSFDADIAVLELEREVHLSEYIQPICLIDPHSEVAKIDQGVIVGYEKSEDESKLYENLPKSLKSSIIYHRNCSENFTNLASLLSNRAFCGGNADGIGTWTGESGSGLFVKYAGIYYLRGIVSSSLMSVPNDCNTTVHSVLTNVLDFNEWIIFSKNITHLYDTTLPSITREEFTTKIFDEETTKESLTRDVCCFPEGLGRYRCCEIEGNYSYNEKALACMEFQYGGCGGNPNRVKSKDFCELACSPYDEDEAF